MSETLEQQQTTIEDRIRKGLDTLNVSYGDDAISKLVEYMDVLSEWNKTHNLTSINDVDEMLSVHILDSASIRPYVKGGTLLDVGSGAGLPGMILAILSPALDVTSVESRGKKAQFQMFVANKLKLKNFSVENSRIEEFDPVDKFANVVARAFSDIEQLVVGSKQAIAPNGRWLAMKGAVPEDELKVLKKLGYKYDTYAIKVPELDAQRNLVVIVPRK
jgi:16S rRNA (guanine527-N7)-methyltransferase